MKKYIAQNISVRGYSHILSGTECQDYSVSWADDDYVAGIVCDGHGGTKYIRSSMGSRIACEVGQILISEFMRQLKVNREIRRKFLNTDDDREDMFVRLSRAIIQEWNNRISDDLKMSPLEEAQRFALLSDGDKESLMREPAKAYGSTFVAAVLHTDFYIILKLGDGNVCLVRGGGKAEFAEKYSESLKDDNLQFNFTTSLCSSSADSYFRYAFSGYAPNDLHGVILTSDGVINSYTSEEGYLKLIKNMYLSFSSCNDDSAIRELVAFLNTLSEKGSGDDLSVAVLCRERR